MTVLHNGNRKNKSNVVFRDGRLLRYDKKHATPDMDYVDYGVALLRKRVLDRIPVDQPFDLARSIQNSSKNGKWLGTK